MEWWEFQDCQDRKTDIKCRIFSEPKAQVDFKAVRDPTPTSNISCIYKSRIQYMYQLNLASKLGLDIFLSLILYLDIPNRDAVTCLTIYNISLRDNYTTILM